jgi:hypothetical protein
MMGSEYDPIFNNCQEFCDKLRDRIMVGAELLTSSPSIDGTTGTSNPSLGGDDGTGPHYQPMLTNIKKWLLKPIRFLHRFKRGFPFQARGRGRS